MSPLQVAMMRLCADMQSLLVATTGTVEYPSLVIKCWCLTYNCHVRT
jgi:hypothetical protein